MVESFFYSIGRAVCHQFPDRTIEIGGKLLPVCARCTGIYAGMLVSFLALFLTKRIRGNKPPQIKTAILLALSLFPFMADGAGSYLGFWRTNNWIRILTGASVGYAIPVFLILLVQFQAEKVNSEPIIEKKKEVLALFMLSLCTAMILYFGLAGYFISSMMISSGIFLFYVSFFLILLSIIFPKKKKNLFLFSVLCGSIALSFVSLVLRGK